MVVHGRTKFDEKNLDVIRLTLVLDVTRLTKRGVITHFPLTAKVFKTKLAHCTVFAILFFAFTLFYDVDYLVDYFFPCHIIHFLSCVLFEFRRQFAFPLLRVYKSPW